MTKQSYCFRSGTKQLVRNVKQLTRALCACWKRLHGALHTRDLTSVSDMIRLRVLYTKHVKRKHKVKELLPPDLLPPDVHPAGSSRLGLSPLLLIQFQQFSAGRYGKMERSGRRALGRHACFLNRAKS